MPASTGGSRDGNWGVTSAGRQRARMNPIANPMTPDALAQALHNRRDARRYIAIVLRGKGGDGWRERKQRRGEREALTYAIGQGPRRTYRLKRVAFWRTEKEHETRRLRMPEGTRSWWKRWLGIGQPTTKADPWDTSGGPML